MFSIIAAIGRNRELGLRGKLVFHIREDMKFFRETTMGHKVVMGRKTWESLPGKLPGRENIVVSSREFIGPDRIVHDPEELVREFADAQEEVFVIGGAKVYEEFLPYTGRLYLTEVDAEVEADVYFPEFDREKYDKMVIKRLKENGVKYTINEYIKK